MEEVITTGRIPIKSWCRDIEKKTLDQAGNLSNLPFTYKHIAIMPDAHMGYGMPIGGVMVTEGVVIPYAVGVDIGCGMCAKKMLDYIPETDVLKKLMGGIRQVIPLGFKKHKEKQDWEGLQPNAIDTPVAYINHNNANVSLGTLGGGNHFIELQKDSEDNLWVMIHSGSRNVGKQVCDYYNKEAKRLNESWCSLVPAIWQLAFLPLEAQIAREYMREMQWCVDFALINRYRMLQRVSGVFSDNRLAMKCEETINIAHNYAAMENHFGKNVMIHRKGATLAREGTIGIIPGSQGTSSYIVGGLGNKESFMSCSHGAGRRMGRKHAQRELDLKEEQDKLNSKGIIHSIRGEKDLDEASGAYKDIDEVMDAQKDLVRILEKLEPLAVIKG